MKQSKEHRPPLLIYATAIVDNKSMDHHHGQQDLCKDSRRSVRLTGLFSRTLISTFQESFPACMHHPKTGHE